MVIKPKRSWDLPSSEVTPEAVYRSRREFLAAAAATVGLAAVGRPVSAQGNLPALTFTRNARYSTTETLNDYRDITTYNNFYEFGLEKSEPSEHAHRMTVKPWTVK